MNEIGSGAFALTAALMVSSTLLERLCVSMYSWMDMFVFFLFVVCVCNSCVKKVERGGASSLKRNKSLPSHHFFLPARLSFI